MGPHILQGRNDSALLHRAAYHGQLEHVHRLLRVGGKWADNINAVHPVSQDMQETYDWC